MFCRRFLQLMLIILLTEDIARAQEVKSFQANISPEITKSTNARTAGSPLVSMIRLKSGVSLQYAESVNKDGIPVVFLHGFTDSRHSFDYLVPQLSPAIHWVVISQRGHGQSDKPETNYLPEDFAADLYEFLEVRNIKKPIIVGHSMGATIAEAFALRHPEQLSGLVLISAVPGLRSNPVLREFGNQVALLKDPIDHAFASDFQKSTLSLPIPESFLDTVINETLKVPAAVWRSVMKGLIATDYSRQLKKIRVPTLLIYGDNDNFSSLHDQEQLKADIKNSKLLIYSGVGHAIHWEKPLRTASDISSFIKEVTRTK